VVWPTGSDRYASLITTVVRLISRKLTRRSKISFLRGRQKGRIRLVARQSPTHISESRVLRQGGRETPPHEG
jgi:hypothetical protein